MRNILTISFVMATLMFTSSTHASNSITVLGKIEPHACSLSIGGNGQFDYAIIPLRTLKLKQPTVLGERVQQFSIACGDKQKIALSVIDGRKDVMVSNLVQLIPAPRGAFNDNVAFGLGTASGNKVGSYLVRLRPDTLTGDFQHIVVHERGTAPSWGLSAAHAFNSHGLNMLAFASPDVALYSSAFRNITGTIAVETVISESEHFATGEDIVFYGNSTMELKYF